MTISLRLKDEELALIKSYANLKNDTMSNIIRIAILEQIELEYDLLDYNKSIKEFNINKKTYTQEEVEKELGLI
jgi:hypothetical protein